uniref:Uncharacterized protein n=1 Tax=Percolomonas cosmopolitus TaxID=63605 RepID=A0A7S1KQ55_9EUKA|mmetsp:Transcript_2510/g.9471  ORF Transcript_2510/g.9471 Transcript_2510/m.9471 type:complete len:609 (+) Transcript_2510:234-2060(+)|eukprot:CAMPEP_0117446370 /NCGR_PEP_ID=MMETSP0759-20121206/6304_1 /TAXON_ID=63605 /ORGANISM="Percolomonas cosmopolitus, Strain WS" /LENGTH=608 /DNA_ID=CAMNT_0005238631 /DNA_START=173 /DNA_END=1999 /DNA_ORIENTATION=-
MTRKSRTPSFQQSAREDNAEKQSLTPKSPTEQNTKTSANFQSMLNTNDTYAASTFEESPIKAKNNTSGFTGKLTSVVSSFFSFLQFPKVVWLILLSEGSERLAFYGFKTVLPLFLKDYLNWDEDGATVIIHSFIFFAYLTPLLGSVMADGFFGKFTTILIMAILYCIGQVLVAVTAIPGLTGHPPRSWGIIIGLFIIGLASGGIKPNVSSMGGEQFSSRDPVLITSFFSFFYLTINLGSTFSTIVTPILRTEFGYAIAFALPAVAMILSTIVFAVGRPWYKIVKPKENIVISSAKVAVYSLICTARDWVKRFLSIFRITSAPVRVTHFLDRAKKRYPERLVEDIKICLRIIIVLMPICAFFALFDQHASRFVFQATHMNRNFFGVNLDADQIQVINPFMIILLVPFFDRLVYPACRLFDRVFVLTPLRRMAVGFVITALSFVLSAFVDFLVEHFGPGKIHVIAQLPQYITLGMGEILVSVTALEFAYQQAPPRMKSLMSAFYLLTVSAGNVIVLIVAALPIPAFPYKQTVEFLVFAGLIMCALGIFLILAWFYKYRDTTQDDDQVASDQNVKTIPVISSAVDDELDGDFSGDGCDAKVSSMYDVESAM